MGRQDHFQPELSSLWFELDGHLGALGHPTAPVLGFLIGRAPTNAVFQASRSQCLSS